MKYFIDAGANNSCSARIFRKLHDPNNEVHIFSFEIDPLFVNHFSDITNHTFINKAVWVSDGTMKFYRDTGAGRIGGSLLKEKHTCPLDRKNPIHVDTLDFSKWVLDNFNKEDEIILKMDIEGAEYTVLPKMMEDLSFNYINELWIEWHYAKVDVPKDRHDALLARINIPMKKWAGIENANRILGPNYLGGL